MNKRRKGMLIILGVAMAIGLTRMALQPKMPVYHGKTLYEWLQQYSYAEYNQGGWRPSVIQKKAEAEEATRGIGTNGIPVLMTLVLGDDKAPWPWYKSALGIPRPRYYDDVYGMLGFQVLGATAKDAIPALMDAFERKPIIVAKSLQTMGEAAKSTAPTLIHALSSRDEQVRGWMLDVLPKIKTDANLALPAVLKCLTNKTDQIMAARCLWEFGPEVKSALPELRRLLDENKEPRTRKEIQDAIREIDR